MTITKKNHIEFRTSKIVGKQYRGKTNQIKIKKAEK